MRNYKIIILIGLFLSVSSCMTQRNNNNIGLIYQKISIRDKKVSRYFTYNSKSGIYESKQLYPDGSYKIKTVKINLTQDNLQEIYDLYVSLKPQNLCNCLFINNEMIYKSSIIFVLDDNTVPKEKDTICNTEEEDKRKYVKIEAKLYEFILPTYRLKFPDEFIQK